MEIFEKIGKMLDSMVFASRMTHGDKWSGVEKELWDWVDEQENFDDLAELEENLNGTRWRISDFEEFWVWAQQKSGKSHDIQGFELQGLNFAILDAWVKSAARSHPKRSEYENFFQWFLRWVGAVQNDWIENNEDLAFRQDLEKGAAEGFWLQPKMPDSTVTPAYLYGYMAGQRDRQLFDYAHNLLVNPKGACTVNR